MLLAAIVTALALGSTTAAAQTTIGQTTSSAPGQTPCKFNNPYDEYATSNAPGVSYRIPTAGVITSWSHAAGAGAGQKLGFKVFRPGPTSFTVIGADSRDLVPAALNTFPVSIPVQAGDVIGVHVFPSADFETASVLCAIPTFDPADVLVYAQGDVAVGGTGNLDPEDSDDKVRPNVAATLLVAPTVSGLTPAGGSIKGAKVTISGSEFAQVSAVSFGGVPAKSFTVDSETQITAEAPASKTLAKVPVTVTTSAGAASSAVPFAYEGCKVPKLTGKKLKAAKKKLKKGDCKAGKVKKKSGATAKTGKVTKQSAKPGKILAPGTKIKITLED